MIDFRILSIERDSSIQCREKMDMDTINEYAERMAAGDQFPPIVLFGTRGKAWPGDGWHRLGAADQNGAKFIAADLRPGGRIDALKYAISANSAHGHRRTNADKRRCVEIALREFPAMSSRAIAEMCGVGDQLVRSLTPEVRESRTCVTGADGKQYPASRKRVDGDDQIVPFVDVVTQDDGTLRPLITVGVIDCDEEVEPEAPTKRMRPCFGMQFAKMAIHQLEQIRPNDEERQQAFATVKEWIRGNEN